MEHAQSHHIAVINAPERPLFKPRPHDALRSWLLLLVRGTSYSALRAQRAQLHAAPQAGTHQLAGSDKFELPPSLAPGCGGLTVAGKHTKNIAAMRLATESHAGLRNAPTSFLPFITALRVPETLFANAIYANLGCAGRRRRLRVGPGAEELSGRAATNRTPSATDCTPPPARLERRICL